MSLQEDNVKIQRECRHVKTEAGTGVRKMQAKEHRGLLAASRIWEETRKDSTQSPESPGPSHTWILAFYLPELSENKYPLVKPLSLWHSK